MYKQHTLTIYNKPYTNNKIFKSHLLTIFYVILKNSWIKGKNTKWRQFLENNDNETVFWIQWNTVKAVLRKKNEILIFIIIIKKKQLKTMVKKTNKITQKGPKGQIFKTRD